MVWSKLIKKIDFETSMMFLYLPHNTNKYISHTLFSLEMIVIELINYSLWKPNLRVVIKDGNNEVTRGEYVF